MKRILVWLFRAAAATPVLVVSIMLYDFLSTGEDEARTHVQAVFVQQAENENIDPAEYTGPFLRNKTSGHYEFYWIDKKKERFALGGLQFFPMQTEIWFLPPGSKIN